MPRYEDYLFLQQMAQQGDPMAIEAFQATARAIPVRQGPAQPVADLRVALAQADTLVHHPGWQFFLNALQARVDQCKAYLVVLQEQLLDEEKPQTRRLIGETRGELTGLKFAATLVPQLVDMGAAVRAATADTGKDPSLSSARLTGVEENPNG